LVKLLKPLDNQKKIKGTLRSVVDDTIVIEVSKDREMEIKTIPFEIIKGAHLVFTEDMFRAILKS
jgi:ribosome maturation factor RimP